MRERELLRECRDLLEEVDRLISQIGSFEKDKTEFRVDEKEQLLVITINDSEGDVFTYKNAYEFLYEYMLNMHSDNIQYLREQYEDMFDDMDVNDWIMKRRYIEYINLISNNSSYEDFMNKYRFTHLIVENNNDKYMKKHLMQDERYEAVVEDDGYILYQIKKY